MIRWDKSLLFTDDEKIQEILATHSLYFLDEVDLKPLHHIIENVFNTHCMPPADGLPAVKAEAEGEGKTKTKTPVSSLDAEAEKKIEQKSQQLPPNVSFEIEYIASEISCLTGSVAELEAKTLSLFRRLCRFDWDAKLVLTMAAFALNYGKSSLLKRLKPSRIWKQAIKGSSQFSAMKDVMLDVTGTVVQFKELPSVYISSEAPALSKAMADIPTVVYLTIKSVVACSTHDSGQMSDITESADKLKEKRDVLKGQLQVCNEHIEKKKNVEAYLKLLNCFDTDNKDNMESIKAIIRSENKALPLFNGREGKEVDINVLKRKNALLLISGLEISKYELSALNLVLHDPNITTTRLERPYEVVWIPIVDHWNDEKKKQYKSLQSRMQWYSVQYPALIEKVVIKLIREVWHFRNNTMLVALDPQGRVISPNALQLMWIWGSNAFPFTRSHLKSLWNDASWRLNLLVDGLDETTLRWIFANKYILLYGGDDVDWVKGFTATAREVAGAAHIELELVYMGTSTISRSGKISEVIDIIKKDKLNTHYWIEPNRIWFFWTRLESLLFSMIQLRNKGDVSDSTMHELEKLLSYDKQGRWAVLSKGSNILVNGPGDRVKSALTNYNDSMMSVTNSADHNFDSSFKDQYGKINITGDNNVHSCCRFTFPIAPTRCRRRMTCPECGRLMAEHIVLSCCHVGLGSETPLY